MSVNQLIEDVRQHAVTHGSLPFWSWNDKLEDDELRRQIGVMHDLGMKGFFMHARGGLETEYLSDAWFHAVDVCVDEAKKYNMEAWSYDENGWPSGFAGGKLLTDPKNHATFLKYEKTETYPTCDHVLGVYILNGTTLSRVSAPVDGVSEYHVILQGWDASMVDTLDASITKKFLELTHAEYKKRDHGDFGGAMPGFFTDEPQYYRWATVWSDLLPEAFRKTYGYDIFDKLPALFIDFDGDKEFRFDYWKLCHTMFINNWIRPVYEWCQANGCRLTGHAVEENSLNGQMWCCGGVMPFYQYEDIPGMDYLGRGIADDIASKQLGSVCAQTGKTQTLSEMFGCCGWDVTPTELKRIAERQYVNGVNIMCQHLYAYSIRGQRKRDYPANYSEHLPWQTQMKVFDNYFNNLGYLMSRGTEEVNTLVIHPIHGAYLTYKRTTDRASIEAAETAFHALSDTLSGAQIPYHWGDETMMAARGKVEGNKFRLGLCTYDYLVVPSTDSIDASTAGILKEFLANGGKVFCFGDKPTRIEGRTADLSFLQPTVTLEEIKAAASVRITEAPKKDGLRQMIRNTPFGKLLYILNLADSAQEDVSIQVSGVRGLAEIDLDTLEVLPVRGKKTEDGFTLLADFAFAGSHVYIETDEVPSVCPCIAKPQKLRVPLDQPFTFAEMPENMLTIDHYAVSYDGGKTFTEQRPIERVRDNLLRERYSGDLVLRAVFTVDDIPESLSMAAEPLAGAVYHINGKPITVDGPFFLDRSFHTVDLLPYIHTGENEITIAFNYHQNDYIYYVMYGGVSESLRNCLCFDTEIECLYLKGHFVLHTPGTFQDDARNSCVYEGGFSIGAQTTDAVCPGNLVKEGYPFFAGTVRLRTTFTYAKGGAAELYLDGRYSCAEIFVNGQKAKDLFFTNHCDLSALVKEGVNVLEIAMTNSNRNLLGPHHGNDPEPYGVGPHTFSMEKSWNGAECGCYQPRYAFVRFGFNR